MVGGWVVVTGPRWAEMRWHLWRRRGEGALVAIPIVLALLIDALPTGVSLVGVLSVLLLRIASGGAGGWRRAPDQFGSLALGGLMLVIMLPWEAAWPLALVGLALAMWFLAAAPAPVRRVAVLLRRGRWPPSRGTVPPVRPRAEAGRHPLAAFRQGWRAVVLAALLPAAGALLLGPRLWQAGLLGGGLAALYLLVALRRGWLAEALVDIVRIALAALFLIAVHQNTPRFLDFGQSLVKLAVMLVGGVGLLRGLTRPLTAVAERGRGQRCIAWLAGTGAPARRTAEPT